MKTIAIKEKTFQVLEELKKRINARSFDELLEKTIVKKEVPNSMFGSLKNIDSFSKKERKEMWKDKER